MLARENFEGQYARHNRSKLPQACQNGHPTRPQASQEPEAYPLGYVEDFDEPRTMLGAVFTSLLGCDVRLRDIPTLDPVSANIRL